MKLVEKIRTLIQEAGEREEKWEVFSLLDKALSRSFTRGRPEEVPRGVWYDYTYKGIPVARLFVEGGYSDRVLLEIIGDGSSFPDKSLILRYGTIDAPNGARIASVVLAVDKSNVRRVLNLIERAINTALPVLVKELKARGYL